MTIQQSIAALLQRELQAFERELQLFPDDETVWRTMPGVPNSAGNLVLHVAGNLQHFVGAVLGGSAYVRDRDREFSRQSGSRSELVNELQKAAAAVRTVVPNLTDDVLGRDFPEAVIPNRRIQTLRFLLHLCAHCVVSSGPGRIPSARSHRPGSVGRPGAARRPHRRARRLTPAGYQRVQARSTERRLTRASFATSSLTARLSRTAA